MAARNAFDALRPAGPPEPVEIELNPCYRHARIIERALAPGGGRSFDDCRQWCDDCPDCEVIG